MNSKRDAFFKGDPYGNAAAAAATSNGSSYNVEKLGLGLKQSGGSTNVNGEVNGGDYNNRSSPPSQQQRKTTNGLGRDHFGGGIGKETILGYVGFANIPNQVYRKAIKRGFEFTLMVVGQSGLGKSTFVNALFLSELHKLQPTTPLVLSKTVEIEEVNVQMKENGVSLSLTLVDTPGFGDAVDNSNCWNPIINYIDRKYGEFFTEETKITRSVFIADKRVHCCLYFISPSGHGLKPLDIEFMKHLHDRVNIIPLIAKADTMTSEECQAFKKKVLEEIRLHQIRIYEFPDVEDGDDVKEQRLYKSRVPFAVVGSTLMIDVGGGKNVRCRKYPWGTVEVDNLDHNDFTALREMLIRTHLIDLLDVTKNVHYENFRCRQLMGINAGKEAGLQLEQNRDPFVAMEEERQKQEVKVQKSLEKLETVFHEKVQGKEQKIKDIEQDLNRRSQQCTAMLEEKRRELQQRRQQLNAAKQDYQKQFPEFQRYTSQESLKTEKSSPDSRASSEISPGKKGKTGTLSKLFIGRPK